MTTSSSSWSVRKHYDLFVLDSALLDIRNRMHHGLDRSGPHTGFDYNEAPARLDAVEPEFRRFFPCM